MIFLIMCWPITFGLCTCKLYFSKIWSNSNDYLKIEILCSGLMTAISKVLVEINKKVLKNHGQNMSTFQNR